MVLNVRATSIQGDAVRTDLGTVLVVVLLLLILFAIVGVI